MIIFKWWDKYRPINIQDSPLKVPSLCSFLPVPIPMIYHLPSPDNLDFRIDRANNCFISPCLNSFINKDVGRFESQTPP